MEVPEFHTMEVTEDKSQAVYLERARLATGAADNAVQGLPLFDVEASVKPPPILIQDRAIIPSAQTFFDVYNAKKKARPGDGRLEREERWVGMKTVFVSGSFDLLNPSDVEFLKEARSHGERLVVGIVGDNDVCKVFSNNSRLMANLRPFSPFLTAVPSENPFPIFSAEERALNILALECVNDVIIGSPSVVDDSLMTKLGATVLAVDKRDHGQLFTPPKTQVSTEVAANMIVECGESGGMTDRDVLERLRLM